MLGLAGAHRVGKTTLARNYAVASGVSFVETSASGTFARLGLDPRRDYSFEVRLAIQSEILKDFEKAFRGKGGQFITDRTPIDMMAYTLADVQRENVTPALDLRLRQYVNDCYCVTNRLFPVILVVQPGIPLKDEPGKAPAVMSYIEHIHSLVMGLVADERFQGTHFFVPRSYTDMDRRLDACSYAMRRSSEKHMSYIVARKESGDPVILH